MNLESTINSLETTTKIVQPQVAFRDALKEKVKWVKSQEPCGVDPLSQANVFQLLEPEQFLA